MKDNITNKVVDIIGHIAGKVTGVEEITAVSTLATLQKEARKALKEGGIWQQEYHGNELVAVIAMLSAMRKVLSDKERALAHAITFIGSFEHSDRYDKKAMAALEVINQAIAGESIAETLNKKEK